MIVKILKPNLSSDAYVLHQKVHINPWSFDTFIDCLSTPYLGYASYDNNECFVGYALLLMVADEATLMDIAVDDTFRRKGYACQLLDTVITESRKKGMTSLWLEVRASNVSATSLYLKKEFELIETRYDYYSNGQGEPKEDALIMRLNLIS